MSSQSTAAKRKQINSKDDCFWSVKKLKLFGMYKDIHCSAISEKSQNSAPSKNILTDPLSPDSTNLMNGHDACTISFYLMGEKKLSHHLGQNRKFKY